MCDKSYAENLLLAPTMVTTMLVEVDELCSNTVMAIPIHNPQIGFCNMSLLKASPAVLPRKSIRRHYQYTVGV